MEKFALNGSNANGDDEADDVFSRHDDAEGLIGDIACWLDDENADKNWRSSSLLKGMWDFMIDR